MAQLGAVEALPGDMARGVSQAWYRPLLRFARTKPLGTMSAVIIVVMVVVALAAFPNNLAQRRIISGTP